MGIFKDPFLSIFIFMGNKNSKNLKIGEEHHNKLKKYCDENGFKMYRIVEKWIDQHCKVKKDDLYGE